jgi:SPX domain protein involved in polyphosphate accumulation
MIMKYRYEIKYILSHTDALALKQQLSAFLDKDKNAGGEDGSYIITSLYFDTIDNIAYYEKMNGVLNRSKYRIRYYNDNYEFVRLEKKMKHNNMTSKKQVKISKKIADCLIAGQYERIKSHSPLLQEFLGAMRIERLVPSVIVRYRRTAFVHPVSDVRITFDSMIHSGVYDTNLWNLENGGYDILDDGLEVLEVKYNEYLPSSIAGILSTVPLRREAVSKFARCANVK